MKCDPMITTNPYLIEILTPRRRTGKDIDTVMMTFAERYQRIIKSGCALSIPDNPLGNLRYGALVTIEQLGLTIDPERILINLNTYHTLQDLKILLKRSAELGIRYLLIVRGDGSPQLPKLQPKELHVKTKMVTSIELLEYINTEYSGLFITGVAFNQYKPIKFELGKLKKKIDSGAKFVVTQPVVGIDPNIDLLLQNDIPIILEAWMSRNVELFLKSVKGTMNSDLSDFDPFINLEILHRNYSDKSVYLSLLDFRIKWERMLPRLLR
jgi:methylenetetrahydrofolate reductase (NADPH)